MNLTTTDLSASALRATFDGAGSLSVGLEEEVMLLDNETFDLTPRATEIVAAADDDPRFKLELPAAQLELVLAPASSAAQLSEALMAARSALIRTAKPFALPAAAGVHPNTSAEGLVNSHARYARLVDRFGAIARRQLVFGLHVHVAVAGAERALAVYNQLRSFLPELAALSANAPFVQGRDSGFASVRPIIAGLLPRQGVPPKIDSWERFAEDLAWGAAAGSLPDTRHWWWELRPHPTFGTLEIRVADTQTEVWQAAAIAAVIRALCASLATDFDGGHRPRIAPTWRIVENRWSALRYGLDGTMADLDSGVHEPTRGRLTRLLDTLAPLAAELGDSSEFCRARELVLTNGASRQREMAAQQGVDGLAEWLAARFGSPGER